MLTWYQFETMHPDTGHLVWSDMSHVIFWQLLVYKHSQNMAVCIITDDLNYKTTEHHVQHWVWTVTWSYSPAQYEMGSNCSLNGYKWSWFISGIFTELIFHLQPVLDPCGPGPMWPVSTVCHQWQCKWPAFMFSLMRTDIVPSWMVSDNFISTS